MFRSLVLVSSGLVIALTESLLNTRLIAEGSWGQAWMMAFRSESGENAWILLRLEFRFDVNYYLHNRLGWASNPTPFRLHNIEVLIFRSFENAHIQR